MRNGTTPGDRVGGLATGALPVPYVSPLPSEALDPAIWWALTRTESDALIVGIGSAILHVLTWAWPTLREPRFWCDSRRLRLPLTAGEGTIILEDAHDLSPDDQTALLQWCYAETPRPRIIATAQPQLLASVASDAFNVQLYEHLKTVQLVLS